MAGDIEIFLDGKAQAPYSRFAVAAGSTLKIGKIADGKRGCRAYLAIKGGLPGIPEWLGSKSTSAALGLGGYQGEQLAQTSRLAIC